MDLKTHHQYALLLGQTMVELVHVTFGGSICLLTISTPNGEKIFCQIDGNGSNKIEIRISTSNNLEVEKVGIHYDINNDSTSKGTQNN